MSKTFQSIRSRITIRGLRRATERSLEEGHVTVSQINYVAQQGGNDPDKYVDILKERDSQSMEEMLGRLSNAELVAFGEAMWVIDRERE